jgi:hypothetical protein
LRSGGEQYFKDHLPPPVIVGKFISEKMNPLFYCFHSFFFSFINPLKMLAMENPYLIE